MEATQAVQQTATTRAAGSKGMFVRHFFEMLVAMMIGMCLLAGLWQGIWSLCGGSDLFSHVAVVAIMMPTNMTIGMAVPMVYRGHAWQRVGEMGVAMYLPFLVLLVPYAAGVGDEGMVLGGGHMLMLLFMIAAMLLRYGEYSQDHRHHARHAASEHVHESVSA